MICRFLTLAQASVSPSSYFQALCDAMAMLADAGAVFIGQSVRDGGTALEFAHWIIYRHIAG